MNDVSLNPVHRPITYNVLDNQGEVVRMYQYDGDGVSLDDFVAAGGHRRGPHGRPVESQGADGQWVSTNRDEAT